MIRVSPKKFTSDLMNEIKDDNVFNGAAALAYYLMLAIFPALIFLLTLLPYLPIANLDQAIMDLLSQALPQDAAGLLETTIRQVTTQKKGGLLSIGLLGTLWAASAGMYAIMQQLNITYDVKEGRSFIKSRAIAIEMTVIFGVLIIGAFALIVLGGKLQAALASTVGWSGPLLAAFAILRWVIIAAVLLLAFATIYYLGPDVEQKFRFVSPGSVAGALLLVGASLLFRVYVSNFGNYNATYGSIGAVVVLMLWLYVTGLVILLGSEVNALFEHYQPRGKEKGEKRLPEQAA